MSQLLAPLLAAFDTEELEDTVLEQLVADIENLPLGDVSSVPAGSFLHGMRDSPHLTDDRQAELIALYQHSCSIQLRLDNDELPLAAISPARAHVANGKRALEAVIGSNYRLIELIANEHFRALPFNSTLLTLEDLVMEGCMAAVEATRDYDATLCPSYGTYLARVVRNRVRTMRASAPAVHVATSWWRIRRIATARAPELAAQLHRQPTLDELRADLLQRCLEWAADKLSADELRLPEDEQLERKMAKLRKQGMLGALRDLSAVLVATQGPSSLDAPMWAEGATTVGDALHAPPLDTAYDQLELSELHQALIEALDKVLTLQERDVLMRRFGLLDTDQWTYVRIAERYDVTAERIRQIETTAKIKLAQDPKMGPYLASFLEQTV